METICITSLPTWHQSSPTVELLSSNLETQTPVHETSPFVFDENINKKLAFWIGDISTLECDTIVNSTNESLKDRNPISEKIYARAGPGIREELAQTVKMCRTGDAKLTLGYNLPAKHVIHTVGPKFNSKYQTAAESALFSCYQKVFQIFREKSLKTLGLCNISSIRRGYPPHEGAHLALRGLRRFMEQHLNAFTLITLVVEKTDQGIYELLLPLYFPRSLEEQEYALYYLPEELGGPNGEPVIQERKIRIMEKPLVDEEEDDEEEEGDRTKFDGSVAVGQTDFAMMRGDQDRRTRTQSKDKLTAEIQRQNRYQRLLRKARTEDLTNLAALKFVYTSGVDKQGRPVVFIIGQRLDTFKVDLEKALLYFIHLLDPIVTKDYVLVYFHTMTTSNNYPSMGFFRELYNVLEYNYKKNLKAFYVIHPTFWSKLITWWFTTFTASTVKNKVFSLGGVEYLHYMISPSQLDIPSFVKDYDLLVNGERYCNPPTSDDL